ncbi:MAG TPA: Gfo/Idh/MocA family oxidoreductase [Planctomycetaceae bacterium]|nr:Gfo/Idh/MocA family oxidoreductase [Planctomycetaceae bacterium]
MSNRTRREFLEQSLFAAAAAATAGAVTRRAFAEPEESSSSPGEKVRIAVLGVRGRGQSHLSGFKRRADCEIVAIVDPDEAIGHTQGVEKLEKETGRKPLFYKDVRKALEDPNIDVVSIATPNHWHALAAVWAIQHGKDVYCEKPVSHNVSEGRRIVQAARKHGRIVQTGTQCRSNPANIEAIQFVKSGGIGTVKLARGLCYKRRPGIGPKGKYDVPASVDYDLWCGPAPVAELTRPKLHYDWHWVWDTGNGDLGNQGIHQMDLCRWGLGVNDLGTGVVSYGGRLGYTDAGETANTQVSIHSFGEKTLVFEVRGLETDKYYGADVGVIFHGSEGYVVMTRYDRGAAFDPDGNMIKTFTGGDDNLHYDNFVTAVRSRNVTDLNADILEGHLSSALCHLGNISYRLGEDLPASEAAARLPEADENRETFERVGQHLAANGVALESTKLRVGRQLQFDPKEEVFVGPGSKDANPMLSREYRKGFEVPEASQV